MVLTTTEIASKGIVKGGVTSGRRPTTYDATVGSIVRCGIEVDEGSFTLKPRQIIWVVSKEVFELGDDTTGLATLKTQWTHQGVLALNVGIVDPGWKGPLAAAVVNFSGRDFVIEKGAPFFRVLFHNHNPISARQLKPVQFNRAEYLKQVKGHSRAFASTFLDMEDLSRTVADQVFGLPRWGLILSFVAVVLALLAISIPVGVSIAADVGGDKAKISALESKITAIEGLLKPAQIDPAKCRRVTIAEKPRMICPAQ